MTWQTSLGDRTLAGTEADLFIAAVQLLAEDLYIFGENFGELGCHTGNPLFDTATTPQKLYLLNYCLSGLLMPTFPPPPPTHILEAAVYFPFAYLKIRTEAEIETDLAGDFDPEDRTRYFFRSLIWKTHNNHLLSTRGRPLTAATFRDIEEDFWEIEVFDDRSNNWEYWEIILEDLAHRILAPDERWKITAIEPSLTDGTNAIGIRRGITDEYLRNRIGIVSHEMGEIAYQEIHNWSVSLSWV